MYLTMGTESIGAVDLFCGVGGLTYGLQQAGIKVVAGIDIDDTCQYSYESNNKAVFIHKSVDDIQGTDIIGLLKDYDIKILVGCAPCQPFSKHQKNKVDRSTHKNWGLLYQFSRIVTECKPHIISMENVPDLVRERVFLDFVETLKSMEYNVDYSIVNAADYGLAQSRKRLILLASRKGYISLLSPTHVNNYHTVREIIGELPEIAAGERCIKDGLHQSSKLSAQNMLRIQASAPNGSWRDWPDELVLACHKKSSGKSYGSVYGRMHWDDLSPTITTQFTSYGTGRFGHPEQDRALSLREGALLQSFPIDYSFISPDQPICLKPIARQIGNAVPPRLGEIVGKSIMMHMGRQ